jgi:hypothetical protein
MKNDFEADLRRMFKDLPEPAADEVFTQRVSGRIAFLHRTRLGMKILLAVLGAAVAAALTPWLASLTGHIALGSEILAGHGLAVILSPAGCAIGGSMGLLVFLRARS